MNGLLHLNERFVTLPFIYFNLPLLCCIFHLNGVDFLLKYYTNWNIEKTPYTK